MSAHPDRPLTRTRLAGACLVAGALLLLTTGALDPPLLGDTLDDLLTHVVTEPGRWTAWALALAATGLVLLPGIAALGRAATGRGAALTVTGACLAGAGMVGMVLVGTREADLPVLAGPTLPVPPDVVAAVERMESAPGLVIPFLLMLPGYYLGLPLLFWGLRRARLVATWVPVVATVGVVGSWFATGMADPWEFLTRGAVAVALIATSPVLLRGAVPAPSQPKRRPVNRSYAST
ncbi:hypothetical protein CLV92_10251 [Kineococcus xinjiangensis]|uniref:Uncharacterized protein n=1 Tax=Kineococcus xinjiangensis TaxID=512762 RepID=A0A2S6IUG0_9ACTN|nr:hypothetical protein [Kineococcus xinjiangensis]PPK97901.1 hypothetical protein CLV92_10251 [Kineococcus xinjiangensis]